MKTNFKEASFFNWVVTDEPQALGIVLLIPFILEGVI